MNKFITISLFVVSGFTLSGCASRLFADRETNPVVEDYISKSWFDVDVGILATTASRRTVLIKMNDPEYGRICSEPPPDVGEALAKSVAMSGSASVTAPEGSGEGKFEYERRLATSIATLLKRSQGLQLLRDINYSLCVDRLNGWISDAQYQSRKADALKVAHELIKDEIPLLGPFSPSGVSQTNTATSKSTANTAEIIGK